jgi:hypothetical protein
LPHDLHSPDPRTLPARPAFAAQALEGLYRAPEYRAAEPMQATAPVADLFDDDGNRISQLLFGEAFDVLDRHGDRVWGQCRRDGVVGWAAASGLAPGFRVATHWVASVGGVLPLNALVDPSRDAAGDSALMRLGQFARDPAEVARRLLGVPTVAGGRSDRGTDCVGLVQSCLLACGRAAPRHSDEQAQLGVAVQVSGAGAGDLVVWPASDGDPAWWGHAGVLSGPDVVIHACGVAGRVVEEALGAADARQRSDGAGAPAFRRIA